MKVTLEIDDKVLNKLMEKLKVIQEESKRIPVRCIASHNTDCFKVGKIYYLEPMCSYEGGYNFKDDGDFYWIVFDYMIVDRICHHTKGDFEVI